MSKKSRRMIGAGISSLGGSISRYAANKEPEVEETPEPTVQEKTTPKQYAARAKEQTWGGKKDPQEDLFNPNTPKSRWDMDI